MKLKKHRRKAEINIVPLIDVLIVLIFFFLMTMQFRNMNVLNITPPKVETASAEGEHIEMLQIGINKDGVFYVNSEEVSEEAMIALMVQAAGQDTKPPVLVTADEDVPLKYVTFVMDQSRKAELDRVRLQTR